MANLALLIAVSVMVTAFAAASITLTVPKLGSASASVTSCDSAVSTSWNSALAQEVQRQTPAQSN
jgi:hypothetical protein